MCQSSQSKEDIIIAQTAAGSGSNHANVEELKFSIGVTNILLSIVVFAVLLVICLGVYWLYKRCHKGWIREEMHAGALARASSIIRRRERDPRQAAKDEDSAF